MNGAVHAVFNLIVNAVGSFVFALACAYAVLSIFRIGPSRGRLVLLSLPLVKVLWDIGRGIPPSSFFWAKLGGASQDLGSFSLGLGLSRSGPLLHAKLGALSGARSYPQSVAELVDTLLSKKIGAYASGLIVSICLGVAVIRLAFRAVVWTRFSIAARRMRDSAARLETRRLGRRRVNVYASTRYAGPPYAAGLFCPYVMVSSMTLARLSPEAKEAVLQHELAHIAHFDPALDPLLAVLSDLFWFLPGLRGWLARFRLLFELRADERAIEAGADRTALASALVVVGEGLLGGSSATLGLVRHRSTLALRVHRLLQDDVGAPRWGNVHPLGKAAILLLVVLSVLQSIFFGNYI